MRRRAARCCWWLPACPPSSSQSMGRWHGRQGLAGPDSVSFFAAPAVTGVARRLRPDLTVAALLVSVGSVLRSHRVTMGEAFGLDEAAATAHGPIVDAGAWNHLPRSRLLLATVPPDQQPWSPPRRPAPWRPGWRPHWQGAMGPFMRAHRQVGDYIQGRASQYAAQALLYHDEAPWQHMPLQDVTARIGALLPAELRRGWALLNRGRTRGDDEGEAERAAEWVGRHGEQHGFRAPDLGERGRATGCGAYMDSLGLGAHDLYDAQGNHFGRAVLAWCLSRYVAAWVRGEWVPVGPEPLDVVGLERLYQRVRLAVAADGVPTEPVGVPADVQRAAALGWAPAEGCGSRGTTTTAAEDGRADR